MKRNVKSLTGFTMGAVDGEIGEVTDFYFDDATWTIRYLIVKTGGWLSGRKVLISPAALQAADWENKSFPAHLTKEQIENSPDIDTEKPVSRQHENELYNYYGWPYNAGVGTGLYGGIGMTGMMEAAVPFEESIKAEHSIENEHGDPHLRSTSEVRGNDIHATDDAIGEVYDFIIDDSTWKINYLIVDTGNWIPGKKVIISPRWINKIDWKMATVYLDLPTAAIKNSPEYDASRPLPEDYEINLHQHYGRSIEDE